jgi:uncharacterized phiE125 gp8 family phage protein
MYTYTKPTDLNQYPITKEEAKAQLRLETDFNDDDSYLEEAIQDATEIIESLLGYDIVQTTYSMTINEFDNSNITIYKGNLFSLIEVLDSSDSNITYKRINIPNVRIPNKFEIEFESTISTDPIKINFICGWDKENVPRVIKRVILMKTVDLYSKERGSYTYSVEKFTDVIERTLKPYMSKRI